MGLQYLHLSILSSTWPWIIYTCEPYLPRGFTLPIPTNPISTWPCIPTHVNPIFHMALHYLTHVNPIFNVALHYLRLSILSSIWPCIIYTCQFYLSHGLAIPTPVSSIFHVALNHLLYTYQSYFPRGLALSTPVNPIFHVALHTYNFQSCLPSGHTLSTPVNPIFHVALHYLCTSFNSIFLKGLQCLHLSILSSTWPCTTYACQSYLQFRIWI